MKKVDYLDDSFDFENHKVESIQNPFSDWNYFFSIFCNEISSPFNNEKYARYVWNCMHEFRRKFFLHKEYADKNSSLKQAKKMISMARKLKEHFDKTEIWDYYYDTGDIIDIDEGIRKTIEATERIFSYASNKKNKKPNIRNAKRELILDLATVWERGMEENEGEGTKAQNNASQRGPFLNFVYSVFSIFSLLPEVSTYYETELERERLERQALKKQVLGAFSTKLPNEQLVNASVIYQ